MYLVTHVKQSNMSKAAKLLTETSTEKQERKTATRKPTSSDIHVPQGIPIVDHLQQFR